MNSGDITATISDHLPQFLFAPNVLSKASYRESNLYEKNWSKFFQTDFLLDYFDKVWSDVLQLGQEDVNLSVECFLNNMNSILGDHLPLKWINKYKFKFKSKSWITPAIQKPITIKNKVPKVHKNKRFTNKKNKQQKWLSALSIKNQIKLLQSMFQSQYEQYQKYLERNKICHNF